MSGNSLEDLRDSYKNSRQSKKINKYGLKGCTYKHTGFDKYDGYINSVKRFDTTSQTNNDLKAINQKYCLDADIIYSLDKKKRWELMSDLTSKMDNFKEDNADVRLYETSKKENCYMSYKKGIVLNEMQTSKGKRNVVKSKANFNSFIEEERQNQMNRNKPDKSQHKEKKTNRFNPTNIYQKKPSTNNIIEHTFIDDIETETDEEDEAYGGSSQYVIERICVDRKLPHGMSIQFTDDTYKSNKSRARYRFNLSGGHYSDLDYYDQDESSDTETTNLELDNKLADKDVDFEEFVKKHAIQLVERQKLNEFKNHKELEKSNKHRTREDLSAKNKIIYIESKEKQIKHISTYQPTSFQKPIPIQITFEPSSTDPEVLKEKFGNKYNEAHLTYPRHFNLNLSEDVNNQLQQVSDSQFVICVWLRFKEKIGEEMETYDVSVCSNLDCESLSIENINTSSTWSVEDVFTKSIDFISKLPLNYYQKIHPLANTKSLGNLDTSNNFNNNFRILSGKVQDKIEIDSLKNELVNKWPSLEKQQSIDELAFDLVTLSKNQYTCLLCFDEKPSLGDCVLIKSCGHGFCCECMRDYVDSRLINAMSNSGKFPCPCCENQLDLSLMINYASNGRLLDTFLRISTEQVLFSLENYKYCPSEKCSKILKVDLVDNPYGIAGCSCGFTMCLRCNKEPHFPAMCSQLASYQKQLKEKGDVNISEKDSSDYISHGKNCPSCHIFMEKDYGCNHMICSNCKNEFCWNCLKIWAKHLELNDGGYSCKASENFGFKDFEFRSKKKKSTKKVEKETRYEDSLNHRSRRVNCKKEKRPMIKRVLKTLDYTDNLKESELFLNETVQFLMELHFICEYSFVSLRGKSIPINNKMSILHAIKTIELVIYQIDQIFENGKGIEAIEKLRAVFNRGLNCIKMLKNIKSD